MSIQTVTHLNFQGQAREALDFYQSVFGGQAMMVSYQQMGAVHDPADADRIIWGQVRSDTGFCVMAYDVAAGTPWNPGLNAFYVSLRGETAQEITTHWQALSEGAHIVQALAPAPWTPLYGMLKDRFGVVWVLDVAVAYTTT